MSKTDNLTDFLTDIANAIREKKGTAEKINPQDFSTEIANLQGGGSGADVVTVSFYNYDNKWLYDKPVIKGDDCVDVVNKGLLSTPTRESDNYNHYSFSGWSSANDNTVDNDVFTSITHNKNLYACYEVSTRYYTVNIYDGNTLVESLQVAYGETANPTYTKAGYEFVGWDKPLTNITSDLDVYGTWVELGLGTDSWETIAERSANGTAQDYYQVGDTKLVTLTNSDGSTYDITVAIAGFNIHRDENGTKNGITFVQVDGFYPTISVSGDDEPTTSLYNKFPGDLKNVMPLTKITRKKYDTSTKTVIDNESNTYIFSPEAYNFAPSSTFGTTASSSAGMLTLYANDYDKDVFPLFKNKSYAQVKEILKVPFGYAVCTRTLGYARISNQPVKILSRLVMNETVWKLSVNSSEYSGTYAIPCFRV